MKFKNFIIISINKKSQIRILENLSQSMNKIKIFFKQIQHKKLNLKNKKVIKKFKI